MNIKPAGSRIAIQFIDDLEDDNAYNSDAPDALMAIVTGVGADVETCKKGDTVLVTKWAKEDGIDVGDNTVLVSDWCVLGIVTE